MTDTEALILRALEAILKTRPSPNAKELAKEIDAHLVTKGKRWQEPTNNW